MIAELLRAGTAARCSAAMAIQKGTSMLHTPPFYIALVFAFFLVVTLSFEKVRVPPGTLVVAEAPLEPVGLNSVLAQFLDLIKRYLERKKKVSCVHAG